MAKHSDSESVSADSTDIDKMRLLCADERRRRAGDLNGNIEDYLSSSSGSDSSDSDASSSESEPEDENGELISPELDAQIMKTLTALRAKDKSVYDAETNFFSETAIKQAEDAWRAKHARAAEDAGLTMAQYQHRVDVEHGGVVDEEAEVRRAVGPTHVEEQRELKDAFKAAAADADDAAEDAGDLLLVKKEKSAAELSREDAEYRKFLLDNVTGDVSDKRAFTNWASSEATEAAEGAGDANQKFLMNYILNRGWINQSLESTDEARAIVDKEEDDDILQRADAFESQYNFRHAEAGGTQIKAHPRQVEGSLRRKDDRRKQARERAKERKAEVKRQKAEELKRAKNQKKKGILEKLKEIQRITGNSTVGFDTLDLDGEFDPDKFQAQMDKLFDSEHYTHDDSVKPQWDDDIDISDIAGGSDFVMDADYLDNTVDAEALASTKSALKDKVADYMDQHYQLDFEDIIGDNIATRFKYTKVQPLDYGLSAADMLLADEPLLNEYVSVKKLAAYRPDWKIDEDLAKHTSSKRVKYIKKKTAALREKWDAEMSAQSTGSRSRKRSHKEKSRKSAGKEKPRKSDDKEKSGKSSEKHDADAPAAEDD
ncbi:Ribosome biogenesis protein Kri1, partial [Coemansia sp. RSA 2611]